MVKSLGPLLASLSMYLGAAILGDGRIALLVDPAVLVRASAEQRGAGAAAPPPVRSRPKVLVVEDSLTIRELQRSILEAAGYRVQTACDGRDALTHIDRDDGIDLVVTDVEMPEMDGIELTRTIRAHATLLGPARRDRHLARRGRRPQARHRRRCGRLHGQAQVRPARPARDGRTARRAMTSSPLPRCAGC